MPQMKKHIEELNGDLVLWFPCVSYDGDVDYDLENVYTSNHKIHDVLGEGEWLRLGGTPLNKLGDVVITWENEFAKSLLVCNKK